MTTKLVQQRGAGGEIAGASFRVESFSCAQTELMPLIPQGEAERVT